MSFDLFVVVEHFDAQVQKSWAEKLRQQGIDCTFPSGFMLGSGDQKSITCKVGTPLVEEAWPAEEVFLGAESVPLEADDIKNMIEDFDDPSLTPKLHASRFGFQFNSSAGRSNMDLLVQCYGAAALADVTDGVLFDPQEGNAVSGQRAYEIARFNSNHVFRAKVAAKKLYENPEPATKSWWARLLGW